MKAADCDALVTFPNSHFTIAIDDDISPADAFRIEQRTYCDREEFSTCDKQELERQIHLCRSLGLQGGVA